MICKRILCVLLAVVLLFTWPGFVPEAHAVGFGAFVGTAAIAAATVAGATLISLGLSPKADTTAWDNAVSGLVDHFKSLGYVVDGMIQVAKFKPTDDAEDLKAAIAQDFINLAARWVSDENIVSENRSPSIISNTSGPFYLPGSNTAYRVSCSSTVYAITFQYYNSYYKKWYLLSLVCSTLPIYLITYDSGWRNDCNSAGDYYFSIWGNGSDMQSVSPFGVPTLPSADTWLDSLSLLVSQYMPGALIPDSDGIDVSSVPANFTDIPAAYPDWVASGADYAGTTYLPINVYIPGSGAEVLPTEVPDVTDATDPPENPDKDPDNPSEGDWLWPGLEIMFTELKENANQIGSAIQEKIDNSLERLGDRVQQLQDGILPQIEAFKDTVTQGFVDCQNWFQGLGDSIASALDSLGTKLSTGIQSLFDTLREFATQTFPAKMAELGQWIQALPQAIADAVKQALYDLFVPSPNYWDDKINNLKSCFPFFDSMLSSFGSLKGFLLSLGQRPPVIYIDLSNTSWVMGGRIAFIDLTWYAEYKTTMDTILSAFLWLLFLWRVFLNLPSIIEGLPGISVFFPASAERLDSPALPPVGMPPPQNDDRKRLP